MEKFEERCTRNGQGNQKSAGNISAQKRRRMISMYNLDNEALDCSALIYTGSKKLRPPAIRNRQEMSEQHR
jgi:hypothetical protein